MNKRKKLEKMATKILKQDEKNQNIKALRAKHSDSSNERTLSDLISKLWK